MYLFGLWFSLDIYTRIGLLDHTVVLFVVFLRNLHIVLLEKEMATHSSILAMKRGAWWATVREVAKELDMIEAT